MTDSPDILALLQRRGFVQQCTDLTALGAQFAAGPQVIYTGYDPTADSLHVGHLVTLMAISHLERAGHRPIVLLGGGTAMIGDPSGKSEMRRLLSAEQIQANTAALTRQLGQFLDLAGGRTRLVNNADWLGGLQLIPFLRDVGRHFSVNRMLTAETYRARLETGLSFIEFNYQLLQAYDFCHLAEVADCRVQLGGDDQWGNIIAGVDLCRRRLQVQVFGLTYPLLTTASGTKMGKTSTGAVWLDAARLSPYAYYQFWINCDDADLTRFLALFTFLPEAEIAQAAGLAGSERNASKAILAYEATAIAHGRPAAVAAHAAAQGAFGGRQLAPDLLPTSQVPRAAGVADSGLLPTTQVPLESLGAAGMSLVDLLVRTQLAASKSAARRLIEQGAVRVGEVRLAESWRLTETLLRAGDLEMRVGKKQVHRITK